MFEFHTDLQRYYNMQYLTARDYIIPMLEKIKPLKPHSRVLEIGCAEAGVLKAFVEKNCQAFGIDLSPGRIDNAKKLQAEAVASGQLQFLAKNIYDIDLHKDLQGEFDIIILKDVIEHIPDQEKIIPVIKSFLKKDGILFFAFPPWQMPFGGHQQMCPSKLLSKLPWFHLLPKVLYKKILQWGNTTEHGIKELLELKDTGISIERFEKIMRMTNLKIYERRLFLTNPIYKFKFGLEPKLVLPVFNAVPFFRNFYTTAVYYFVGWNDK